MSSKHTPGPWKYHADISMVRVAAVKREDGTPVAFLRKGYGSEDYDGALIAEAPEMLKALERCVEALQVASIQFAAFSIGYASNGKVKEGTGRWQTDIDNALEVIAKAKGEA